MTIQLFSVPSYQGCGANDGAYYPVGLLSIGGYLKSVRPETGIAVVDLHHCEGWEPRTDLVGISASSTLNYKNVLSVANRAKNNGSIVVLGGPHATQLAPQILSNRTGLVDYIVRGNGEQALASLVESLENKKPLVDVPNLSWRDTSGKIIHNPVSEEPWRYDDHLPLDFGPLNPGVEQYWATYREKIDPTVDAAFIVFTHFGCGYRQAMQQKVRLNPDHARWCSYCSLNDPLMSRRGGDILAEVLHLVKSNNVRRGSKVMLKCYGDNVGTQDAMLEDLALAIERCEEWKQYDLGWTFYAQSSRLDRRMMTLFSRVGTWNLYIGFDSADNYVQKMNGLGTSVAAHWRAAQLCQEYGIKIQAGFVLGCAGETTESIHNTIQFASELAERGLLERVNSAVLFIIPGSPAYELLCFKEPWIRELDDLPTEEIQWYWVKHFCPRLANNPSKALETLRDAANRLDDLSPGPHASMGYQSSRFVQAQINAAAEVSQV